MELLKGPKGDKGDPGPQGPPGKGIEFAHLIVYLHMKYSDCYGRTSCDAQPSDFTLHVDGNNQSPDTFQGSETGTNVTLGAGSYKVTDDYPSYSYHIEYGEDCNGVVHFGETKECIVTNTYYNPNPGGV